MEEPDGKLYPRSNTANSVLDVLRLALEGQPDRLTLRTGDPVTSLKCRGQGFTVTLESGEVLRGMDCVILAAGGAAGSKVGGVLDGYRLAKGLGHHRTALTPALVQLKTDPTYPRSLKGVKNTARITLRRGREVLAENHGEILFTEYGVSGPAIFEISRYAIGEDVTLSLDLWPEQSEADTAAWLRRRQALALRNREFTCGQAFTGALHSRLSQMAAKYAGLSPPSPWQTPRRRHWRRWPASASILFCPSPASAASIRHKSPPEGSAPTSSIPTPSKAVWSQACMPAARCWTWTATAAATICNGHGPAAIWPGSFDKNSRILRILRNILLFYGISLASFLVSMGYTAS